MKKSLSAAALAAGLFVLAVPSVAGAEGPPKDPFDANDATWGCEAEADLPPEHCINPEVGGQHWRDQGVRT